MPRPHTLAVHAQSPDGRDGVVLVLWPPDADGTVAFREWRSDAWMEPGRDGRAAAADLEARIRGWKSAGWRLSEPADRLLAWLRPPPG